MTQHHHEITVHATSPVHGSGPVFYASMPCTAGTLEGPGTSEAEDRHRLATTLWDHRQSSNRSAFPIQVVRGPLGRPRLLLGDDRGPAISFSQEGGTLWAALSGDESDIGIDAARADEFTGEYPHHRVFHPQELQHALRLTGGDLEQASALLWSVKEAVVKALGCAFHLVDPRQITVYPSAEGAAGENGGPTFAVGLSGKAEARFPMAAGRSLWVRSLPRRKMWLSIALLQGQHK